MLQISTASILQEDEEDVSDIFKPTNYVEFVKRLSTTGNRLKKFHSKKLRVKMNFKRRQEDPKDDYFGPGEISPWPGDNTICGMQNNTVVGAKVMQNCSKSAVQSQALENQDSPSRSQLMMASQSPFRTLTPTNVRPRRSLSLRKTALKLSNSSQRFSQSQTCNFFDSSKRNDFTDRNLNPRVKVEDIKCEPQTSFLSTADDSFSHRNLDLRVKVEDIKSEPESPSFIGSCAPSTSDDRHFQASDCKPNDSLTDETPAPNPLLTRDQSCETPFIEPEMSSPMEVADSISSSFPESQNLQVVTDEPDSTLTGEPVDCIPSSQLLDPQISQSSGRARLKKAFKSRLVKSKTAAGINRRLPPVALVKRMLMKRRRLENPSWRHLIHGRQRMVLEKMDADVNELRARLHDCEHKLQVQRREAKEKLDSLQGANEELVQTNDELTAQVMRLRSQVTSNERCQCASEIAELKLSDWKTKQELQRTQDALQKSRLECEHQKADAKRHYTAATDFKLANERYKQEILQLKNAYSTTMLHICVDKKSNDFRDTPPRLQSTHRRQQGEPFAGCFTETDEQVCRHLAVHHFHKFSCNKFDFHS